MTILKSFDVASLLISSNIEADKVLTYDPEGFYVELEEVEYLGYIYTSVSNANMGKQPDISSSFWNPARPANTTAIFDDYISTISMNIESDIVLEFDADDVTLIAFNQLYGASISIKLIDKNTNEESYSNFIDLREYEEPHDIYDYFFDFPKVERKTSYLEKLPMFYGQTLHITITKTDKACVGFLRFGQGRNLGCTQTSSTQFREKSGSDLRRINGNLIPIETVGWTEVSFPVKIDKNIKVSNIIKELRNYRARPLVVIADDTGERDEYTVIGIYSEFEMSISNRTSYTLNVFSMD